MFSDEFVLLITCELCLDDLTCMLITLACLYLKDLCENYLFDWLVIMTVIKMYIHIYIYRTIYM